MKLFAAVLLFSNLVLSAEYVLKININAANSSIQMSDDCVPFNDFKGDFGKSFNKVCKAENDIIYKCQSLMELGPITAIKFKNLDQCKSMSLLMRSYKSDYLQYFK